MWMWESSIQTSSEIYKVCEREQLKCNRFEAQESLETDGIVSLTDVGVDVGVLVGVDVGVWWARSKGTR